MRAVAACTVALLAIVGAHAVDPAGNWSYPSIARLAQYDFDTTYQLHTGVVNGSTAFAWAPRAGFSPAVEVKRNKGAAGWELIQFEYNATLFSGSQDAEAKGYYAAGYAEGYLTFDDIYSTYVNQVESMVTGMPQDVFDFVQSNVAFQRSQPNTTDFNRQLAKQLALIDGIADGWMAYYKEFRPANVTALDWNMIYYTSYMEGLSDVIGKFQALQGSGSGTGSSGTTQMVKPNKLNLHCSALMKLTANDLFFAHDTWGGFNTMLRQYKTYKFGDMTVSMSGYAGSISSIDDFYVTSNNLAITETTNEFFNTSLYHYILTNQVPEFNRVMIANFLADTPERWFSYFSFENSGTYNNQYMVANMQQIRDALDQGKPLPDNSFWVGEQIPGLVVAQDQTNFLNEHKHWPSFNIPYYPNIYNLSGFGEANEGTYGLYSYTNYSRAVIFKRMQAQVTDEASMYYMMRYNNWETDPASAIPWCKKNGGPYDCKYNQSAGLTVAARFDLCPADGLGPDSLAGSVSQGLFGAIDVKMTSARMVTGGKRVVIQNGPTAIEQPVFSYSAFIAKFPSQAETWRGVADVFDFGPVALGGGIETTTVAPVTTSGWVPVPTTPSHNSTAPNTTAVPLTSTPAPSKVDDNGDDSNKSKTVAIAVGVVAGLAGVGILSFLVYRLFIRKPHADYNEVQDDRPLV